MKHLIFLLFFTTSVRAWVLPAPDSSGPIQDELLPYQWGLINQGQTLIREKDDLHNLRIQSNKGKDIGWSELFGVLPLKRPVVAVLDSGVDLEHWELQGNLWKNEKECGKDPAVDNDGNKLAGDCHGWNFTEAIDSEAAKSPQDQDGHGTHIAGIIAALNNSSGMVGVIPNALIMPIKVMKDSNSNSTVPSSEAFARGIVYAVENGADVINMSLGWPRSLETKALRDAVNFALSRGVPIVAAAGNNNSSEPLYPCAYDGVICVGATSVDGRYTPFSNYGGHVDVLAPGELILGLHPTLYEPEFFSVPGFELRSGTSQAAPLVSGLVAVLRAQNPQITIDEILARIYSIEPLKDDKKYAMGGLANWRGLTQEITTPVIRPVFKKFRQIILRPGEIKLPVAIRNFGEESSEIKVSVESLSSGITLSDAPQFIPALKKGEFKDLGFDLVVNDLNTESSLRFKVNLEVNEVTQSFLNELPVLRDPRTSPEFKKIPFRFTGKALPLGQLREGVLLPFISTVDTYGISTGHEYLLRRTLKEEKKIELTLLRRGTGKYQQLPTTIYLENALSLVNFLRVDLNSDGKEDYLVQVLAEKNEEKYFYFAFYDENLSPLWSGFQNVKLNLDLWVSNLNELHLLKYTHPRLGTMMVPAFFTPGMLPKIDQALSSWQKTDQSRIKRLYYLEPSEGEFRLRALNTRVWDEKLKKSLKLKWYETVEAEQILTPTEEDIRSGELRLLISAGLTTKRQIFIASFGINSYQEGAALSELVVQSDEVDPLLSMTANGLAKSGDLFFNIYDRTRAKLIVTKKNSQLRSYVLRHEEELDVVAGHIASFETSQGQVSILQSREELIHVQIGKTTTKSTRPKLRYSFLSQRILSEMYYPVFYNREGEKRPALYVDATSITGNRLYLIEDQEGQLVSSIRNSLLIPPGCRALNPSFDPVASQYEFSFLCLENQEFVMRTFPIN